MTRKEEILLKEINPHDYLDYDRYTGVFYWKHQVSRRIKAGGVAGTINSTGYVIICIKRKLISAHRLAWYMVNGSFPINFIDHIDRNRTNNRISNLREATIQQNGKNQKSKVGATGYQGVTKKVTKNSERYRASITVNNKTIYLGTSSTPEKAHQMYVDAKRKYHEYSNI